MLPFIISRALGSNARTRLSGGVSARTGSKTKQS